MVNNRELLVMWLWDMAITGYGSATRGWGDMKAPWDAWTVIRDGVMARHLLTLLILGLGPRQASAQSAWDASPDAYNIVWQSPSEDHCGSMPLGNGDIGPNAWIEPGGDLVLYISKTDPWDDNGRLVKTGRVRVKLDPAPPSASFRQTLVLREGTMQAVYGERQEATIVRLWVDANRPVIQAAVSSPKPITATASIELWRATPYKLAALQCSDLMEDRSRPGQLHQPVAAEPDTLLHNQANRIGWYHHNAKNHRPNGARQDPEARQLETKPYELRGVFRRNQRAA